ncbi:MULTISPECIES: hypothetical protein [Sporosarcina]|uniref:hypothetical protein n=1 Tax=Sporosarcina TaxID=1569 RepID=UPI0030CCB0CA
MEDIDYLIKATWHEQCLNHCESFGISSNIINLLFHLQGESHEQDNEKTTNSRVSNEGGFDSKKE